MKYVLSIDQGTSGSKALLFGSDGSTAASVTVPLNSHFFNDGFVEQDPEILYQSVIKAVQAVVKNFLDSGHHITDICAAAITNQRESFLLWDKNGKSLTNVVVWQCKRSITLCSQFKDAGYEKIIRNRTGLMLDPYFSGTKVAWLMKHDQDLDSKCKSGEVFFGTIDTWLLYKLTNGKEYKTDYTNASRTLFFNIDTLSWDKDLLALFDVKNIQLPDVLSSSANFGQTTFESCFSEAIPIYSMIGDSHSACFGEGCLSPGTVKATMGTGSSVMMNTGATRIRSTHGMVSTICWSIDNRIDYALEGVIVSCGSTVNWFKNQLGLVSSGKEFDKLAESVSDNANVIFLPAFSGLGGPFWQMDRKAEINGITFGTTKAHIIRAALESYPFQLKSVINAMEDDQGSPIKWLKADGGLTNSNLTMQYIADLLAVNVNVDKRTEASGFGTALLAFLKNDILNMEDINALCANSIHTTYMPSAGSESEYIKENYKKWLAAVKKR